MIVSLSAPTHAAKPCERGPGECVTAKPAPPHHRKAHRPASAQPTDPDVFVARPVATDAAKKSPAPARKAKGAQP